MKRILITISALLMAGNLYAYDWSAAGFTAVAPDADAPDGTVVLKDAEGRSYIIENEPFVTDETGKQIEKFIAGARLWKLISWKEMKFLVSRKDLQFSLYPVAVSYKGENLMPNIPGGIIFSYDDNAIKYDARLVKNNRFMKVHGIFIDEDILCAKISEVLNDPESSARRRDPDYMLMKLNQLELKLEKLEMENSILKRDLDRLSADEMAFQNNRMFYSKKMIDPAKVAKIVEIKRDNPSYKAKDIEAKMKEQKIDISGKEIAIVLGVYFNEFGD